MRSGFPDERASMAARSAVSGARSTARSTSKRWKSGRSSSPPATSATRPCCRNFWTRSRPIKRSPASPPMAPSTPASAMTPSMPAIAARAAARDHTAPQERQTMEALYRRGCRPQRSPARITPRRSNHLATMEPLSPPEPRRNLSRARKRSGGSFSRRMDALCQTARPASGCAGLRPSGRRVPDPRGNPERLHRARHTRH